MRDAALKAKWINSLRSGAYRQGKQALHNEGAYCCLGVLCKLAGADLSGNAQTNGDGQEIKPTAFIDETTYTEAEELNSSLLGFFGIGGKVESELIAMNDTLGRNFQEIAAWIESHDLATGEILPSSEPKVSGSPHIPDEIEKLAGEW